MHKPKGASTTQREWASTGAKQSRDTVELDKFSDKVKQLGLTDPKQYAKNKKLASWVKQMCNHSYVPEELLRELGLTPDLTLGGRNLAWGDGDCDDPNEGDTMEDKMFNDLMANKPPASSYAEYEQFNNSDAEAKLAPRLYLRKGIVVPEISSVGTKESRKRKKELPGEYRVYSLTDPRNSSVFYVGITTAGLKTRLGQHLGKGNGTGSGTRVRELLRLGRKPIITSLEVTTDTAREMHWIKHFLSLGVKLENKVLDAG